ncbi:hypothetical protein SARC_01556 [Sphaeroforma arctica JP610]|uniref:FAD-binding PCMH-type domain-containing protein n=1 Tax=Sphaeroforma arctica JP610 TaxID=667725 RepID=A0A0L0GBK7_9EUKA|nr:hypothetical protein SARC_01556 [Sphaeroforma arctica JP610]KNC86294.1 hypothetical protein SARC_01556 [Sphaeroforma arctica JP610]|eukprot:XP_014160196.1 hypothetical protein SARC_01556 [Sphaeroforma arctica JP610]
MGRIVVNSLLAITAVVGGLEAYKITPRQATPLGECISTASPNVTVYGVADPFFLNSYIGTNLGYQQEPTLVVKVQNVEDIKAGVVCAKSLNEEIVVRNGGNSFAGFSYSSGIVLNLDDFIDVQVDTIAGKIKVESGNRLGRIYGFLVEASEGGNMSVIGAGTWPYLGIAGHSLCAGYGMMGRKTGYITDQIEQFEVVNATGDLIVVSEAENSELFYAMRGGCSSSFGFITSVTIHTTTIPSDKMVYIDTRARGLEDSVQVGNWWQQYASIDAPEELTTTFTFGVGGDDNSNPYVRIRGVYLGSKAEAESALLADFEVGFSGIFSTTEIRDMFVEHDYLGGVNAFTGVAEFNTVDDFKAMTTLDRESVFYKTSFLMFDVITEPSAYEQVFQYFTDGKLDYFGWKAMGGAQTSNSTVQLGDVDHSDPRSPIVRGHLVQCHLGLTDTSNSGIEATKATVLEASAVIEASFISERNGIWRYPGYLARYDDYMTTGNAGNIYFGEANTEKLARAREDADGEGVLISDSSRYLF